MDLRKEFEKWAAQPPREWDLKRQSLSDAWPGQYYDYSVQCAWEAWNASYNNAENYLS